MQWQNIGNVEWEKNLHEKLTFLLIINLCPVSEVTLYILTSAVAKYWKYLAKASLSHK